MSTVEPNTAMMSRHLHIVLDDATYQQLRTVAFARQTSLGAIVRQALAAFLGGAPEERVRPAALPAPASGEDAAEGR